MDPERLVLFGVCCKIWPLDAIGHYERPKAKCGACGNVPRIIGNNAETSRSALERQWGIPVTLENDPDEKDRS